MITSLQNSPTGNAGAANTAPSPRLVHAAHEFEAQLMKELMKPMTKSASIAGDDDSDEGSGGTLTEFASESMAKALSEHGGLGIAHQIIQELSHSGNMNSNGKVTQNMHDGTV